MIIDTHVHIGGEKVGFQMSEEMVLEAMEKYHVDYAIVSNGDAAEVDHEQNLLSQEVQLSQEEALLRVLAFARKNPTKIGVGVWVKPLTENVTPELEKLIRDNLDIIYAIKLHPFHSKISPVDERVIPYLELAKKYHLAVVSHTGGCEEAEPVHLYETALKYPEIPFVMVHMGLGSNNQAALELLGKADNLYGDTAWVPMATTEEAIRRYGSRKMMFGSDMPIDGIDTYLCNPWGERSVYQDYLHVLPEKIGMEAYEALMWKNAVRVFGLKQFEGR
ncbi:MAG: amidohydrolase [Lachnospiraceae bacterium]|nr:amidohydrolase [Lachnospiraceae bacterium]